MKKEFEITLPGSLIITLRTTTKESAVIHVRFLRDKKAGEPETFAEIDKGLLEGSNFIVKLQKSIVIPKVQMNFKIAAEVDDKKQDVGSEDQSPSAEHGEESLPQGG